jgi:hypothetical protein
VMYQVVAMVFYTALCVCIAFTFGRRIGIREGRRAASSESPLRMRVYALETGRCPVCLEPRPQMIQCGLRGDEYQGDERSRAGCVGDSS